MKFKFLKKCIIIQTLAVTHFVTARAVQNEGLFFTDTYFVTWSILECFSLIWFTLSEVSIKV